MKNTSNILHHQNDLLKKLVSLAQKVRENMLYPVFKNTSLHTQILTDDCSQSFTIFQELPRLATITKYNKSK